MSKDVTVEIVNDGSLPVNGVTLSISTGVVFDPVPTATVVLKPAVDREIVKQDEVLIVRLKNPLGPKEHVSAVVTFIKDVTGKRFDDDFKLGQAYVDSEVGAGILVASLAGDPTAAARKDVK